MKKIYMVHCWDGNRDDGWYPWLDENISDENVKVYRFNMPDTNNPKIDVWVSYLSEQVKDLDSETYFVGHSIGCQTIMRYLQDKDIKIGGILFVAPWLELLPEAVSDKESLITATPWLNTPICFDNIRNICDNITCIFSDNDYFVPLEQESEFKKLLNAKTIIVNGMGHISIDDGIEELEEAYDALMEIINKN